MQKLAFPLLSILAFYLGNSVIFTLLAVTLDKAHIPISIIGLMTSAYFIGMIIGVLTLSNIPIKVGHIRAFTGFSAGIIIIFMLHSMLFDVRLWIALRLLTGCLVGGLFLTIESWMMSLSNKRNRGQFLAFYMVAIYVGYILGQLSFELPVNFQNLYSLSAIACAASIIPLAITKLPQPRIIKPDFLSWNKLYYASNIGPFAAFSSGLIISAIYGLLPVFLLKSTGDIASVGLYMAMTIIGGIVLQYPFGKLSDNMYRPLLLGLIYLSIIVLSLSILFFIKLQFVVCVLLFLFGGFAFAIYPIILSHICDRLEVKQYLSGTQSVLILNAIGSAIGPLIASIFMKGFGSQGLFIYFAMVCFVLAVSIGFRLRKSRISKPEESHIVIPSGTTHIAAHIDPRINKVVE